MIAQKAKDVRKRNSQVENNQVTYFLMDSLVLFFVFTGGNKSDNIVSTVIGSIIITAVVVAYHIVNTVFFDRKKDNNTANLKTSATENLTGI